MATFWEIAAHSFDHMFSMYFDCVILVISRFCFEGWIWVQIASVPDRCILFTFCLMLFFLSIPYKSYKNFENAFY